MNSWREWRKSQRMQLVKKRKALTERQHKLWSTAITSSLLLGLSKSKKSRLGAYFPIHGEYDPRPAMDYFEQQGIVLAVPEITDKNAPFCYRKWWPDAPMKKDVHGIPTPDGTDQIAIDIALVPMVGFDRQGYRLGYGKGYFDRTLASLNPRPTTIGIAFEMLSLDNVFPQPHDIPMDYIVTEMNIYQIKNKALISIPVENCSMSRKSQSTN